MCTSWLWWPCLSPGPPLGATMILKAKTWSALLSCEILGKKPLSCTLAGTRTRTFEVSTPRPYTPDHEAYKALEGRSIYTSVQLKSQCTLSIYVCHLLVHLFSCGYIQSLNLFINIISPNWKFINQSSVRWGNTGVVFPSWPVLMLPSHHI